MADIDLEAQDSIKFASIESLVSGIQTKGLALARPGLYIATSAYPEDTRDEPLSQAHNVLKKLTSKDAISEARLAELTEYLQGRTLVDLGAGKTTNGYQIARMCGAKGYVAIEANHFSELRNVLGKIRSTNSGKMPVCVVGEDMRDFVKRIPDGSVAVFAFNIDEYILNKMPMTDMEQLKQNISRILASGSAYIGSSTSIPVSGLREIDRYDPPYDPGYYIIRIKS
ncbi:MAG: hypothetical protein Q7S50_00265 [bacterium]|nr:hypothetical protein [bacterium]